MLIYIDSDFCCHISDPDYKYRGFEVEFFNDKCQEFVEGFRYIPPGETWIRSDGVAFKGEMITPFKEYGKLEESQIEYEMELISEYSAALSEIEMLLNAPGVSGTMNSIIEKRKQAILSKIDEVYTAFDIMGVTI